ncbi:hypothetical protein TWF718_000213 [Orbilia javanica]|uniref:Uncharacterized protein n=1 Tax=Orbilia javanica TaxID=47235 RepID=A0AAN8N765_9PEZI
MLVLFSVFLIFITSCSHAFLLAQTFQPFPGGEVNRNPTVEIEIFEEPEAYPEIISSTPNARPLRRCNPRTNYSKWNRASNAKAGGRWDKMGDPTTIRYLAAVNWGDTLPLEAIAFYSTATCAENSLAMVIRFFEDEDTAQIVQLTESYIPKKLSAWQAISISNSSAEYSNPEVSALASSMVPGSVLIPPRGKASLKLENELNTNQVYCTGLVHRAIFYSYNIANLRAAGIFDVRNLMLRVKDQIRSSEIPETRKYHFQCIPVPQTEPFGEIGQNTGIHSNPIQIPGSPIVSKGDRMVNSIIASDYAWDEGLDLEHKRLPEEVVNDILDLDRFDGRQRLPTMLKVAVGRLTGNQLDRAIRPKRDPAIGAADLDIMQAEEEEREENDPNVIVIPRKTRRPRVETLPRFRQTPGKISKKIANLLGVDSEDPSTYIGIDTQLLGSQNEFMPKKNKDNRLQQDYVFEDELNGIVQNYIYRTELNKLIKDLSLEGRLRKMKGLEAGKEEKSLESLPKKEEYNPAQISWGSDVEEIIKEEGNNNFVEAGDTADDNLEAVLPSTNAQADTKDEDDGSMRAQYVEEIEAKEEDPQTGEYTGVDSSVKVEYGGSEMKEEEPV